MEKNTLNIMLRAPVPKKTKSYTPISHREIIDTTKEGLLKEGLNIRSELYATSLDGKQAVGRYIIGNVSDGEIELQLCWKNSYDKSISLGFATGGNVIVCTNGMVKSDLFEYKRKHTGSSDIEAPVQILEGIKTLGERFRTLEMDKILMKNTSIDPKVRSQILGRLFFEEDLLKSTQMNIIKREITNPSFDYGSEGSLWETYQYITHSLKELQPRNWIPTHLRIHNFMMETIS